MKPADWRYLHAELFLSTESSIYFRTSWSLSVKDSLKLVSLPLWITQLSQENVDITTAVLLKKNVFARHSYERNFYIQRLEEFKDRTIVLVKLPGKPDDMRVKAERMANCLERAALASTIPALLRKPFQREVAITHHRREVLDFVLGPKAQMMRTVSQREKPLRGVVMDKRFINRFKRFELESVVMAVTQQHKLGTRMDEALTWLVDSRLEPSLSAAYIKTAIALEALLGGPSTEPLTASLSERTAFLLTNDPTTRQQLSKAVKNFYAARSAIVHGNRGKQGLQNVNLLESIDRLILFVLITLAANKNIYPDYDSLQKWVLDQKWGSNQECIRPYTTADLRMALDLSVK